MCKQVNDLTEFVQEILLLKQRKKEEDRKRLRNGEQFYLYERNEFLYRGQPDTKYMIVPSIGREKNHPSDFSILEQERNLIEMAKYKLPDYFKQEMKPVERLALLQHHKIYTRLLDVTENPLVALYFACCKEPEADGEVIVFQHNNYDVSYNPIIDAIADTAYLINSGYCYPLEDFYRLAKKRGYFLGFDHMDCKSGVKWIKDCCSKPFFIYSPIRVIRQQMQRGRYILFPNKIEKGFIDKSKDVFSPMLEPIPRNDKCIAEIYNIPNLKKDQILADLDTFGINEQVLFSDNIDIVCEGINNNYK